MKPTNIILLGLLSLLTWSCQPTGTTYDLLITNAVIYDGSGNAPITGKVAINADTIAAVGDLPDASGEQEIDAEGKAISPGFINMLSWATESLLIDPRAMSDIKQGVTLEVMGEGWTMGPMNETMRAEAEEGLRQQPEFYQYDMPWTTLGEYLQHLEDKGVGVNVASFVGATTLRIHELGYEDRAPTEEELGRMQDLARQAMDEGALGVGSSLIYAPAFYAETDELIALCQAVAPYGGRYITHMRSEANNLLEAIDEVIEIAEGADIPAEIYHLKAGGTTNWPKMDQAIAKIDSAREAGLDISTNMYNYIAGATGLNAAMPPWVQEGGYRAWADRLQDPAIRQRVAAEMRTNAQDWENLYFHAGPDKVLLSFQTEKLRDKYEGQSLAEVAADWGKSPEETAMDLVIQDSSRVGAVYFLMSEDNVKKQIQLPYMAFGSDAGAPAAEEPWTDGKTHPRTYGNFARLLGKYVREEQVIPLEEAIYKLTSLPAERLQLQKRGRLEPGYKADVVLFDPETITDHATFLEPHQYATGVIHVWVNGTQVLQDGEHTGEFPGRFVKGPGGRMNK
jgi:N-acyl-D-amino-acid deacylase